jgi:hypothetical protein
MESNKDRKFNIPLSEKEREILEKYEPLFINMLILFYEMGCKKVWEIPFTHNNENYKIRIEKE